MGSESIFSADIDRSRQIFEELRSRRKRRVLAGDDGRQFAFAAYAPVTRVPAR
jgi:hypothetical protein